MKRIVGYIMKLASEKFFGTVTLYFREGTIHSIKVESTLRPTDLPPQ